MDEFHDSTEESRRKLLEILKIQTFFWYAGAARKFARKKTCAIFTQRHLRSCKKILTNEPDGQNEVVSLSYSLQTMPMKRTQHVFKMH